MSIFFMFGKYSTEALKKISSERTDKAVAVIKKHGGEVKSMYCLLGEHDLILIVEFPNIEQAMMASVDLHKLTGISFTTSPVVDAEKFDRLIGEAKEI
ncbi:MAG: GYD domain-containing protein [Proteobacteria bacterium]|nr:GYD domain-containing protein [Pseudomonadota bacterium]